jgi:UDP-N-acetyl-2-amino-2-deoxyglucuronate dehydrogenase
MRTDNPLSWMSICTPNYTHDAFIRYGLRLGCNVICEKPLVLNPYNIDNLIELERETGKEAYTILQLRLHDRIAALKKKIEAGPADKIYDVDLTYITSRGKWYYSSWKGDVHKAGGIATNIGVHFYDMLQWLFGEVEQNIVHVMSFDRVAGYLQLKRARVRYFLSINAACLPDNAVEGEKKTYRTLSIDGEEFEFSQGFTELHTESYRQILAGNGFRISEARPSIEIVSTIRSASPIGLVGDYHPLAKLPLASHPFGWDEKR